jgi:hypothetical protein
MESIGKRQGSRASHKHGNARRSERGVIQVDSSATYDRQTEESDYRRLVQEIGSDSASGTFAFYRFKAYCFPD